MNRETDRVGHRRKKKPDIERVHDVMKNDLALGCYRRNIFGKANAPAGAGGVIAYNVLKR